MQKKLTWIVAITALLAIFVSAEEIVIGTHMTLSQKTEISDILTSPENFTGKKVRVEGKITDGCFHSGRWIEITDKSHSSITVQHPNGKIKFPTDHKGKYAIVEGTLYVTELNEQRAMLWLKHLQKTHRQAVDFSRARGGMKLIKINPSSAVLK